MSGWPSLATRGKAEADEWISGSYSAQSPRAPTVGRPDTRCPTPRRNATLCRGGRTRDPEPPTIKKTVKFRRKTW